MTRQDEGLAFMLRYDNRARFEDGEVLILDRRVYPAKKDSFAAGPTLRLRRR